MKKQKLTKKQSEIIGAAMMDALYSRLSFQEIMKELSQNYGFEYHEKSFQKGVDKTVQEYNEGKM